MVVASISGGDPEFFIRSIIYMVQSQERYSGSYIGQIKGIRTSFRLGKEKHVCQSRAGDLNKYNAFARTSHA